MRSSIRGKQPSQNAFSGRRPDLGSREESGNVFWVEDMTRTGKDRRKIRDLRDGHSLGSLRGLITRSSLNVKNLWVPLAHF